MIGLIQRVSDAIVTVEGEIIGRIGRGLLVLCCVEAGDGSKNAVRLAERLVAYRVFEDESGRMNLSVADISGQVLLVPQFTLGADTSRGNRPSFSKAAEPALAERLFAECFQNLAASIATERGQFGANMQVSLTNDGPVTFWLTA